MQVPWLGIEPGPVEWKSYTLSTRPCSQSVAGTLQKSQSPQMKRSTKEPSTNFTHFWNPKWVTGTAAQCTAWSSDSRWTKKSYKNTASDTMGSSWIKTSYPAPYISYRSLNFIQSMQIQMVSMYNYCSAGQRSNLKWQNLLACRNHTHISIPSARICSITIFFHIWPAPFCCQNGKKLGVPVLGWCGS